MIQELGLTKREERFLRKLVLDEPPTSRLGRLFRAPLEGWQGELAALLALASIALAAVAYFYVVGKILQHVGFHWIELINSLTWSFWFFLAIVIWSRRNSMQQRVIRRLYSALEETAEPR